MKNRKGYLIAGVVLLLISLCIILPIEKRKSYTIEDFGYTYATLAMTLLLFLYSLMGKNFFKGLLFVLISIIISICGWFIFFINDSWVGVIAIWMGVPTGIIAALLFLIFNFYCLSAENKYTLFLKRLLSYTIILGTVSLLFAKGGDWFFKLSQYLAQ